MILCWTTLSISNFDFDYTKANVLKKEKFFLGIKPMAALIAK